MAAKKTTPPPLSPDARAEVLCLVQAAEAPIQVKQLCEPLKAQFGITEKQLAPVLDEFVSSGQLFQVASSTPTGKPRYWHRDYTEFVGTLLQSRIAVVPAPITVKDLAPLLLPELRLSESELNSLLQKLVASGQVFEYPATAGPKGKLRYWHQQLNLQDLARDAALQALEQATGPLTAAQLVGSIVSPVAFTEADLTDVLNNSVTAGRVFAYPGKTAKAKAAYWTRNLQELAREPVLNSVRQASAPITAKELATSITVPQAFAESDLTAVLAKLAADGVLFEYPGKSKTAKAGYWDRDRNAVARQAIVETLENSPGPMSAKEVASKALSVVKFTEPELAPVLDLLAAEGTLHTFPAAKAGGPPRFWNRDLVEVVRRSLLQTVDVKGPQSEAGLRKLSKELPSEQFDRLFEDLLKHNQLLRHPALPGTKAELFGVRPVTLGPYLKGLGQEINKVVAPLLAARVEMRDLRQALRELLEAAGISLENQHPTGTAAITPAAPSTSTPDVAEVDLIELMKRLEPGAERGALVGARELRRAAHLEKSRFDALVLQLAQQGKLALHRHDYATSLTSEQRDDLVTDGAGTYYVGMAFRKQAAEVQT